MKAPIVIPANFSDESVALLQWVRQWRDESSYDYPIHVVTIETGWASKAWEARLEQARAWAVDSGFEVHALKAVVSFDEIVRQRQSFPTVKFQWCAGFLKGSPLLDWLNQVDPANDFTIALAKRQTWLPFPLPSCISECPYHGDRTVWHPLVDHNDCELTALIEKTPFVNARYARSQECQPCVNLSAQALTALESADIEKASALESELGCGFFEGRFGGGKSLKEQVLYLRKNPPEPCDNEQGLYYRGCGNPFGCGL